MSRVLAFSLLALAAFDAPVPWLDRAGVALLGLAFYTLAAGRTLRGARPALFGPRPPAALLDLDDFEPTSIDLPERIGPYGDRR